MFPFLRSLVAFCAAFLLAAAMPVDADEASDHPEAAEQVGAPTIDTPIYPRSSPANPWVGEPAPIEATLLFMPTIQNGKYHPSGVLEDYLALRSFEVAAPGRLALPGRVLVRDALKSICRFESEDVLLSEDSHVEVMRRYFGASHVVQIDSVVGEETRTAHVRLHGPDGVEEASFESPRTHEVTLANRIVEWLVEQLGDLLSEEDRARVLRPLHGRAIVTTREEEWKALTDDAANPAWEEWIAEYPNSDYVRYMWVDRAALRKQRELYPRTVPPPGDGTVGPMYLGARGRVLGNMGHTDVALHDFEIILARYPGITGQVDVYFQYWQDDQSKRTRLVRNAELWHSQLPPAAAWDLMLAGTHLATARAWADARAQGLSMSVARRNVRHHAEQARDLIDRAVERGGPLPELMKWGYVTALLLQEEQWFFALFSKTIKEFPESIAGYRWFLTYATIAKERMTVDMAQAFIKATLEHHPDWLHAAQLYDDYLLGFPGMSGRLERDGIEGDVTAPVLRDWIAENEGWEELTLAVSRHIVRNDPTERGAARALAYAWLAKNFDLLDEIVRDHPRVIFMKHDQCGPVVHRTTVRHPIMNALRRADHLDLAFEYTTDLFENQHDDIQEKWSQYQLQHIHAHHAVLLTFQGRAAEADEHWEQAGDCTCLDSVQALSWAYANHRLDEVRAHISKMRRERRNVAETNVAEIILLAREGKSIEARAIAEKYNLPQDSTYPYLKRILEEELQTETAAAIREVR